MDTKNGQSQFHENKLAPPPPAPHPPPPVSVCLLSQRFIYLPLAYDPQALSGQTHVPNIE